MPDISDITRGNMFAEETGDGLLALLTISTNNPAAPIRVVHNKVDVQSQGKSFTAFPFNLILPTNEPDSPSRAQLTIDNVSREILLAVREITSAPTVTIQVVRLSDPNEIELSLPPMRMINVRADFAKVTGDLVSEDLQLEPYPAYTFSPAHFPGLF